MDALFEKYKDELENELQNILVYWQENAIDRENGGFYGRINNNNTIFKEAPKGSVLNSRILWTFSAAFNLTNNPGYLKIAERAFAYLRNHFIDKEFVGVFWTVDFEGNPLDTKKQIYAQAFAIYGLSEFYISSKNEEAKELAIQLYNHILEYSYDKENGGYIEALSRDWKEIGDLRLSKKDANEKKSMNTHLHLLEAFSNLYRIWTNEKLEERIIELIFIFLNHIIDRQTHHLVLFFDEKWNKKSHIISYGHDIEAAWLLEEAAAQIKNDSLLEQVKNESVQIATATTDGLDKDGGLWYEFNLEKDDLVKEKHWWPQAEAIIGFFNGWQITGDENFLQQSLKSWQFVQKHILDKKNGEWFWGIKENNTVMDEDKVGIWKCPYHNSRSCIELIKRIKNIITY
ncbi:MAG: AGE family epimerase/isomerase [Bacteroidota bacterium]|nr:AGE family epimerase/isomerase [Bacteroidota bacterium]